MDQGAETKVNAENLPVEVSDLGDETTANDDQCTKTSYVINGGLWMQGQGVRRPTTYGVACSATPAIPGDVIMHGAQLLSTTPAKPLGTAPIRGPGGQGGGAQAAGAAPPRSGFAVTTTTYDANGRATSATDALNRTTRTPYTSRTRPVRSPR